MKIGKEWSRALLKLVNDLNNFNFQAACTTGGYARFYINKKTVGTISPSVLTELINYPDVFVVSEQNSQKRCDLSEKLDTVESRTEAFNRVLVDLRQKDTFKSLRGWRSETYAIYYLRGEPPLCHVERAGCTLFGFKKYGVHINGYTFRDGELKMWIGHRSKTKPTFPDMLDNMCAGGLSSGLGMHECAVKESREEASLNDEVLKQLKSVGALSYVYVDRRGVSPETEYIFDVELPEDFTPQNADGEMENFFLFSIEQIQEKIMAGEFKPNCGLVCVDFLMRHGYITPDNEPNYLYIQQMMHASLQPHQS